MKRSSMRCTLLKPLGIRLSRLWRAPTAGSLGIRVSRLWRAPTAGSLGILMVAGCASLPEGPADEPGDERRPAFGTSFLVGQGGDSPRLTAALRGGVRAGRTEGGLEVSALMEGMDDCRTQMSGTRASIAETCLLAGINPQFLVGFDLIEAPIRWTFDAYGGGAWLWLGEPADAGVDFLLTSGVGTRVAYPLGALFGGWFEAGVDLRWHFWSQPDGSSTAVPVASWAGGLYLGARVFE